MKYMQRNSLYAIAFVVLAGCGQESADARATSAKQPPASDINETAGATLCQSDEHVVFSCGIERSRKTASVCASPDMNDSQGHIVYRYGRPGRVELTYPEIASGSFSKFFYAEYTRPLLTRQTLRFINKDHEYLIEVENNSEESPHTYGAGISVSGPRSLELELKCASDGLTGIDANVEGVLPCDGESVWAEFSCPN
ncbi:hypothetical protein ACFQZQ_11100 [Lysobacter koreensis]|uniref:Lipoprotein n=1 Tax=Lysobacter koreensis TaxID=266122 RepID=A0ABW2YPW3_9GAMM